MPGLEIKYGCAPSGSDSMRVRSYAYYKLLNLFGEKVALKQMLGVLQGVHGDSVTENWKY